MIECKNDTQWWIRMGSPFGCRPSSQRLQWNTNLREFTQLVYTTLISRQVILGDKVKGERSTLNLMFSSVAVPFNTLGHLGVVRDDITGPPLLGIQWKTLCRTIWGAHLKQFSSPIDFKGFLGYNQKPFVALLKHCPSHISCEGYPLTAVAKSSDQAEHSLVTWRKIWSVTTPEGLGQTYIRHSLC